MADPTRPRRVLIMGAAGRDFHNFNVAYRDDPAYEVVAFTAAQIPGIAGRRYPPVLAGPRYPAGIPIEDESALEDLCRRERVDTVVFAYSDVTQRRVMELATVALGCGADFTLLGPDRTMLPAAARWSSSTAASAATQFPASPMRPAKSARGWIAFRIGSMSPASFPTAARIWLIGFRTLAKSPPNPPCPTWASASATPATSPRSFIPCSSADCSRPCGNNQSPHSSPSPSRST